MKRIHTFALIALVAAATVTGCQKFDRNPGMTGSIGSESFKADGQTRVIAHVDTATHNPQVVYVVGTSNVYSPGTAVMPVIMLKMPNSIGTYNIDNVDTSKGGRVYTASSGSMGSKVVSGQIKVANISKGKIQGTFTLTCADGTNVTNGQYIAVESFY